MLRSRTGASPAAKSVSHDTAQLLITLHEAGLLTSPMVEELGEHGDVVLAQMVLDGILEVEVNGQFICGPAALEEVVERETLVEPKTALAELSRQALVYAEALPIDDAIVLSERLYAYNGVPASLRWRRLLPDPGAVEAYLGIGNDSTAQVLDANWHRARTQDDAWIAWSRRGVPHSTRFPAYKLYVSPSCTALPFAFFATAKALSASACVHWKVGNSALGLLRSDKMVAYFQTPADLQEAAVALGSELSGCEAHGVPFSAQIDETALLSWGIDPMPEVNTLPWLAQESWRILICRRLGASLALAKQSASSVSPAHFARERLRLEGINPDTWTRAA